MAVYPGGLYQKITDYLCDDLQRGENAFTYSSSKHAELKLVVLLLVQVEGLARRALVPSELFHFFQWFVMVQSADNPCRDLISPEVHTRSFLVTASFSLSI